jgi:predicted lactoylglutathione lyase
MNPQFSNADASGLSYNDEFSLMLLTHDFTKTFLLSNKTIADSHKTCEVLNAVQLDSKDAVDALVEKAIAA